MLGRNSFPAFLGVQPPKKTERGPQKLSEMQMNFPIKLLFLLLLLISANGCAFIPLPLIYMNHIKTAYDTVSFISNSPTSNDIALSSFTGKRCRVVNMLAGEDVCRDKSATEKMQEYIGEQYSASNETGIAW